MSNDSFLNSHGLVLCAGIVLAAIGLAIEPPRASSLAAQETGDGGAVTPPTQQSTFPPAAPIMGNANSNNTMIAVTGIDLTGSSILYLVDTQKKQLAIYQATGGTDSMQGVKLVGARRIDLDLQLEGFNDRSQYPYEELEARFAKIRAGTAAPVK